MDIKMPDGEWVQCKGDCETAYWSQVHLHAAKEADRGGGGGSGGD